MALTVRRADTADLPLLPAIESSADALFAPLGIVFPPGPTVVEEAIGRGWPILVSGDPPVGFAAVRALDEATHLEQIAVRAELVGRGIGAALLREVLALAPGAVTLITFRDVPWNAPWYARWGFAEAPADQWGAGLREMWRAEVAAGLHDLGGRIVMRHPGRAASGAVRPGDL